MIVGTVVTLAGVSLARFFLNAAVTTGNLPRGLSKTGWLGAAVLPAMMVGGLFLLQIALRREWSALAAKRVMTAIAALVVLVFLFVEWVPMARCDNSIDADKLLRLPRETLKHVKSELERIISETEEIASTDNLVAKANEPNTIYTENVDGELTLENLISPELKQQENSTSDEDAQFAKKHSAEASRKKASQDRTNDDVSIDDIWSDLGSDDRTVRHRARIALEHLLPER